MNQFSILSAQYTLFESICPENNISPNTFNEDNMNSLYRMQLKEYVKARIHPQNYLKSLTIYHSELGAEV